MLSRAIIAFSVALILIFAGVAIAGRVVPEEITMYTHIVKGGDTLWSIAKTYARPGCDLRKVVYNIRLINSLENPIIYPGQVLMVPVEGK